MLLKALEAKLLYPVGNEASSEASLKKKQNEVRLDHRSICPWP